MEFRNSLSLKPDRFQAGFQLPDGLLQADLRLMGRGELLEKIEIDPVGALVRLGILVDGNLRPGDLRGDRFRQVPDLVVPFVASDVHRQEVAVRSMRRARSPNRSPGPCP